ncbi:hypothetical protein DH2020_031454 [Rehmannia glutinosa]|uniref:Uncharacterized protein n=1 Tax=Rehmannia glutinosa TaxID=99300 RepID=A0ABR0VHY8_REHGL
MIEHHKGNIIINFLVALVLLCMKYDFAFASAKVTCIEKEREALLTFKKGLIDHGGVFSSWRIENVENMKNECCKWNGVFCSNTTGHVTALLLPGNWSRDYYLEGNKISSSLLDLHHLENLDLSGNEFGGTKIPKFIGSLKNLRHLNLRQSNFSGIIPLQIGNIINLQTLDISSNDLLSENLNWLSHLSLLSRFDLSYCNISDPNWLQNILKLPSLQELYLQYSYFPEFKSTSLINSSSKSLSILDLTSTELDSSTFDWLFNVSTSLTKIYLSNNRIKGQIPDAFAKLNFLEYLDLSRNMLEGEIPKSLKNLSHLQNLLLAYNNLSGTLPEMMKSFGLRQLSLRGNNFTGSVPESLGQLSKLEFLDVSFNYLKGIISESNFKKLGNLKVLDLSFNSLAFNISPDWIPDFDLDVINLARCETGPGFPTWIRTQRSFSWLDLSNAGISSKVPKWLWSNLSPGVQYLNLSHNQISGTIPDFSPEMMFVSIDVSYNKFSGPVPLFPPSNWIFQLSQNMFSGPISSICDVSYGALALLDLSSNRLTGEIPNCWEQMSSLHILNLGNNSFSGAIPHGLGSLLQLETLHLRDNNLSGKLPSTLQNCSSLRMIDIGGNRLTGKIPGWIVGANFPDMTHLSFRGNRFRGSIPSEICSLTQIQMLDLSRNNFSGKIPQCFDNFGSLVDKSTINSGMIGISFQLTDYNVSSLNIVKDYIDYALVQWKGQELEYRRTLTLLKLVDLSGNRLVGDIPGSFSSLKGLISLNLSRNSLTGNLNHDIGQMEMLECLDLSSNRLSGTIPIGLARLHYLAVLDLANNDLTGKIPSSTQLQSFNASAFAGNSELCGLPLTLCPGDGPDPSTSNQFGDSDEEKDDGDGILTLSFLKEFGISIIVGFIFGFWGVVGSLLVKESWRRTYFSFWDGIGNWLYVRTTVLWTKLWIS